MEEDPLDQLDSFFDNHIDEVEVEKTKILLIARPEIAPVLRNYFDSNSFFEVTFLENLEDIYYLLLQESFTIVILDLNYSEIDPIELTNAIRNTNKLIRIIAFKDSLDLPSISEFFNNGSLDALINFPPEENKLMNLITEQEAKYSIRKAVTSFISEPPKLSKASFLLLDPTLQFGDENQPINFVGVMIVVNTVPKYEIFFEETLSQDSVLFAGYLSSITSLGNNLFQNEESLKEINFGGISVIFRFIDDIQISFFVRNLSKHNYEKAEKRIDQLMDDIFPKYSSILSETFLENKERDNLDKILIDFEKEDVVDEEHYEELQRVQSENILGNQTIVIVGQPREKLIELQTHLNMRLEEISSEGSYETRFVLTEDEASTIIQEQNVGVIIFDYTSIEGKSGAFVLESIEELDPSVQKVYLSKNTELAEEEIEMMNTGNLDYLFHNNSDLVKIEEKLMEGLKTSWKIKHENNSGIVSDSSDMSVAKAMLKEDLQAYDEEMRPELHGIILSENLEPIYYKFWESNGDTIDFDVEMMAGLVKSLKQISGEIFTEKQDIDAMELGGSDVFVRFKEDFMFIFFVKNLSPVVSVLVSKEINAVTALFYEIIDEAKGVIPYSQLTPIFSQISIKTHNSFTELLDKKENKDEKSD